MGVRGLETFIEVYCKEAFELVNIREIAEKYMEETGLTPIMVVDIASCLRPIYAMYNIDWLCGGQFQELERAMKEFLEAFTSIGIKLVIVFDAAVVESKFPVWLGRMKQHSRSVEDIMFLLSKGASVSAIDERHFKIPPCAWSVVEPVILNNKNCYSWFSVREADEELAEFAATHECFAFLAKDTDFIIFEGPRYYLSIKNLDLKTMTTRNYNRTVLAKCLRIDVSQLALFATLCGNDIVTFDKLKDFHQDLTRWLGRVPCQFLLPKVANYVRQLPLGREVIEYLPKISYQIFGTNYFAELLRMSLESYWIDKSAKCFDIIPWTGDSKWDEILKKGYENHVHCLFVPSIYGILIGSTVRLAPNVEDTEDLDLLPCAFTLLPLRKKLYGILLKEKPNRDSILITEWVAAGGNSLDAPLLISPWFIDHPGLLTLWDEKDNSKETNEARWRTFCSAVSDNLNYEKVMKKVPKELVLPFLALFFLHHETKYKKFWKEDYTPVLKPFELDAFLAVIVFVNMSSSSKINKMIEDNPIDFKASAVVQPRAVHLCSLFQRTCCQLLTIALACGNLITKTEASAANFFDGKIFQFMYNRLSSGDRYNVRKKKGHAFNFKRDQISRFKKLKKMILEPEPKISNEDVLIKEITKKLKKLNKISAC